MSELEEMLAGQLTALRIPFTREVRLVDGRQYKWDFLVGDWAIEVQGGIWRYGGHNTGTGITRDARKHNALMLLRSCRDLYVTGEMIESGEALKLIEQALGIAR